MLHWARATEAGGSTANRASEAVADAVADADADADKDTDTAVQQIATVSAQGGNKAKIKGMINGLAWVVSSGDEIWDLGSSVFHT